MFNLQINSFIHRRLSNNLVQMKDIILSDEYKKPELFYLAKLPISDNSKLILIELHSIMYIEAYSSYSQIYTTRKSTPYISTKNIGYFEKHLPHYSFLRIHNSYVINLNEIVCILREHHWQIELKNGKIINVSDDKKDELLKKLGLEKNRNAV